MKSYIYSCIAIYTFGIVMMKEVSNNALWLPCPKCGVRTKTRIYEDTILLNYPLYCSRCKQETKLGVLKFKIVVSDEPDA